MDVKLSYPSINRYPLLTLGKYSHPIERAFEKCGDVYQPVTLNNMAVRTQDFETKWFESGQFYLAMATDWVSQNNFTGPFNALVMPWEDFTEIDTIDGVKNVKKTCSTNLCSINWTRSTCVLKFSV